MGRFKKLFNPVFYSMLNKVGPTGPLRYERVNTFFISFKIMAPLQILFNSYFSGLTLFDKNF